MAPHCRLTNKPGVIAATRAFGGVLSAFCDETDNCFFLTPNTYGHLTDPATQLSLSDTGLKHFNADGYRLYGDFFREVLKDELAKY